MVEQEMLDRLELWKDVQGARQRLVALNLGLVIYFPIPFKQHAVGVKKAFDSYLSIVDWSRFRFQNLTGTSKGYKKLVKTARATIDDWLSLRRSYGSSCAVWLSDGAEVTEAADQLFNLFGRDVGSKPGDSNFLEIRFPWTIIDNLGSHKVIEEASMIVSKVPFYSAYLGYMLGTSTLLTVSPYHNLIGDHLFAVGSRFIGVDIHRPVLEDYCMRSCVRPPSWVTFLSHGMLEKIGGAAILQPLTSIGVRLFEVAGGIGIQAGSVPQLGDRNRNQHALPEQRAVAQAIQELPCERPAYLFSNREYEDTLAWYRRLL